MAFGLSWLECVDSFFPHVVFLRTDFVVCRCIFFNTPFFCFWLSLEIENEMKEEEDTEFE